jgi:dTDP-4-amino-4,6-dideoxygalactose transaminase
VAREILTLPLHTHMAAATVERVAGAIREHLGTG